MIKPFEFHIKISELSKFYSSMKSLGSDGVEIGTFDHTYNGVESCVIFDTRNSPFVLTFIKRITGKTLTIPIYTGFVLKIEGNNKYKELLDYFSIQNRGKGEFKIKDFINHFSRQIPAEFIITDKERREINSYDIIDKDSDGIYPIGIKNWEVINAKRKAQDLPELGHRTSKNLEKVKNLYPNIYDAIKDKDISVCFGKNKGINTDDIVSGKLS